MPPIMFNGMNASKPQFQGNLPSPWSPTESRVPPVLADSLRRSPEYEKYADVLYTGELSVDGLRRIIHHDNSHAFLARFNPQGSSSSSDPENTKPLLEMARKQALTDVESGLLFAKKEFDEPGDLFFGVRYPIAPVFFHIKGCDQTQLSDYLMNH